MSRSNKTTLAVLLTATLVVATPALSHAREYRGPIIDSHVHLRIGEGDSPG